MTFKREKLPRPFYQPWEHEHMHDVVAQENVEGMDKDKDGRVSLQEYLG